jgi:hypothetical protein
MKMIPASQVVELFDGAQVAPGVGNDLHVGGYENDFGADKPVYFPGGYGTVGSLAESVREAGPVGFSLAGGGRRLKGRKVTKTRKARKIRKAKKTRKTNKNRRVRFSRRSNKKVRFSRRNQLFHFRK